MFQAFALRPMLCGNRPSLQGYVARPLFFVNSPYSGEDGTMRCSPDGVSSTQPSYAEHAYEDFGDGESATEASLVRTRKVNVSWR